MSRVCQVTGKRPMYGNKISHSNRKTRRRQEVNIQKHRFWSPERGQWVRLTVSTSGIREINKLGIDSVLRQLKLDGVSI